MKKVNKSYIFPIFPTKDQEVLIEKHFEACRFVYNYFLGYKKMLWDEGININYYDTSALLTILKHTPGYEWLNEVSSLSLIEVLKNLDKAYKNFFSKSMKFPIFKTKYSRKSFFNYKKSFLKNGKLILLKFNEGIKINLHRDIINEIKGVTVTKLPSGKYVASIFFEEEHIPLPKTGKQVGIDFGLKDLIITSDNEIFKAHKFFIQYQKELAKAQQHLSRKVKGSSTYEKQKIKVAHIHAKIANCRKDLAHKISIYLVKNYDLIALEDLTIKNMAKNRRLSKAIMDAGWGQIRQFITYKANWNDKEVIKIDRFFPSSRLCNVCDYKNKNLTLDDRHWDCPQCGSHHNRDFNAAQNILNEGLRIHRQGLSITKVETM